jgi:hypothetical protein
MTDSFSAARLARKNERSGGVSTSRSHTSFLIGAFGVIYLGVALIGRRAPGWLAAIGVSPAGVNLLLGTAWCGLGVWGIRSEKGNGAGWILLYVLCLLGGILTLSKAFALF